VIVCNVRCITCLIVLLCFYFRVIQNIADSRPKVRYIIAVDDSKNTMEEIVKVRITLKAIVAMVQRTCNLYWNICKSA